MRDARAVTETVIVQHRHSELVPGLFVRTAGPARTTGALVELFYVTGKLGLELCLGVGLLLFVNAEPGDRTADHVDASAGLGHANPQIVIHAVVEILANLRASAFPNIAREHHFRLIKKLSGVPAAVKVQQVVERQRPRLAAGHVMRHRPAAAPERDDARHQIGPGGMEAHRHPGQRARRQHVVAVQPGQDVAGGQRHALVDGVTLPFVLFRNRCGQAVAVALHDAYRAVLRAAVHHDVLDARVALAGDGKDRLLYVLALIVRRGDDRNERPPFPSGQSIGQWRGRGNVGPLAIAANRGGFVATPPLARGLRGRFARRRRSGEDKLVVVKITRRQLRPAPLEDIRGKIGRGALETPAGPKDAVAVFCADTFQKPRIHPVILLAEGIVDDERRASRQFTPDRQRVLAIDNAGHRRM